MAVAAWLLASCLQPAAAGPLRDQLRERWAERQGTQRAQPPTDTPASPTSSPSVQQWHQVAYGSDSAQRMDIHAPQGTHLAPVIMMVHGGGWRRGDKASDTVVTNKLAHWSARGYVFISINYPMLPQANPLEQAQHVARALAYVQKHANEWGGDANQVALMGHSAGAHLVALLSSQPAMAYQLGAKPWRGTVALDSAAMNVVEVMQKKHFRLYDEAFGTDTGLWTAASPYHQLSTQATPMLLVCSSQRTEPCPQAHDFSRHAQSMGVRTQVLEQPLSHQQINDNLGKPGSYTDTVDQFLRTLGLP